MISVIIPTHNRPDGLRKSILSIFNQSQLPSELIVVDDGSEDPVTEKIFANAPSGLRTQIIRNNKPMGANSARNYGVVAASCDWVAFLDDDDEFYHQKIEVICENINHLGSSVDILYHSAHIHMVNEDISYISKPKVLGRDNSLNELLIKNYLGGTPMVVVKKKVLVNVGLFDEKLPALQDYELWIRLAKRGATFHYIDIPLTKYHHVTSKNSITKSEASSREALKYIQYKYSDDYSRLSQSEIRECRAYQMDIFIHKSILNKKYLKTIKLNFIAFIKYKKLKYLIGIFGSLLGYRFMFKVRAIMS